MVLETASEADGGGQGWIGRLGKGKEGSGQMEGVASAEEGDKGE